MDKIRALCMRNDQGSEYRSECKQNLLLRAG